MDSVESLKRQVAALERRLGPPMSDELRGEYTRAQVKANAVAHAFGDSAPSPLPGEPLLDYRARLASKYQTYSQAYKDSDLRKVGDPIALSAVEDAIYADAAREATHPTSGFRPGELRAIVTHDQSGRPITRYVGDPNACWDRYNAPFRYITRFMTPGSR